MNSFHSTLDLEDILGLDLPSKTLNDKASKAKTNVVSDDDLLYLPKNELIHLSNYYLHDYNA